MKYKKIARDEIWTRAGLPPVDLESAALDRSATRALDAIFSRCNLLNAKRIEKQLAKLLSLKKLGK